MDPRSLRQFARQLQLMARVQEMSQMSPEQLQKHLMKKELSRLKRKAKNKVQKSLWDLLS